MMDLFSQPATQPEAPDEFDAFKDARVIEFQPPTAVFLNASGGVTIMQDHTGWMSDRDVMVVLTTREAVRSVIAALQRELAGM